MASRHQAFATSAELTAAAPPALLLVNGRWVLAFDAATAETAYFPWLPPQGLGGTITVYVHLFMASATSGNVNFTAAFEAITPLDTTDLDSATSFGTANDPAGTTVPGTAGYEFVIPITMTNDDAIAAGDYVRIALTRDATDGTNDTASGDAYVLAIEVRDSA